MTSKHYMHTVSALAMGSVALYAGSSAPAEAQDGFSLTFFGGLGDVTGGFDGFESGGVGELGQFGGVMLGSTFGTMDASVSLSYYNQTQAQTFGSGFFDSFVSGGTSGGSGGVSGGVFGRAYSGSETNWMALDMNVAMPSGIDERLQWIIGARILQYEASAYAGAEGLWAFSGGPLNSWFIEGGGWSEFTGLGPRFAARYSSGPVAGQFGFTGEVGASLLYGRLEEGAYVAFSSGGPGFYFESGYSEMRFATNIDVSLQADYYLSDNASFFIGWQAQQMLGLTDLTDEDGRTQTVTIGFTTEF